MNFVVCLLNDCVLFRGEFRPNGGNQRVHGFVTQREKKSFFVANNPLPPRRVEGEAVVSVDVIFPRSRYGFVDLVGHGDDKTQGLKKLQFIFKRRRVRSQKFFLRRREIANVFFRRCRKLEKRKGWRTCQIFGDPEAEIT